MTYGDLVRPKRREEKWTRELYQVVMDRWHMGDSCEAISRLLCERGFKVSRSAVASCVRRLRETGHTLQSRPSPIRPKEKTTIMIG